MKKRYILLLCSIITSSVANIGVTGKDNPEPFTWDGLSASVAADKTDTLDKELEKLNEKKTRLSQDLDMLERCLVSHTHTIDIVDVERIGKEIGECEEKIEQLKRSQMHKFDAVTKPIKKRSLSLPSNVSPKTFNLFQDSKRLRSAQLPIIDFEFKSGEISPMPELEEGSDSEQSGVSSVYAGSYVTTPEVEEKLSTWLNATSPSLNQQDISHPSDTQSFVDTSKSSEVILTLFPSPEIVAPVAPKYDSANEDNGDFAEGELSLNSEFSDDETPDGQMPTLDISDQREMARIPDTTFSSPIVTASIRQEDSKSTGSDMNVSAHNQQYSKEISCAKSFAPKRSVSPMIQIPIPRYPSFHEDVEQSDSTGQKTPEEQQNYICRFKNFAVNNKEGILLDLCLAAAIYAGIKLLFYVGRSIKKTIGW